VSWRADWAREMILWMQDSRTGQDSNVAQQGESLDRKSHRNFFAQLSMKRRLALLALKLYGRIPKGHLSPQNFLHMTIQSEK